MNNTHNNTPLHETTPANAPSKRKRFVRSLEYELIANLTRQQYSPGNTAAYDRLLAIPLTERIPGLLQDYGLRRMHRLITLILQEFSYSVALPRSKKLTETQTAVCACDIILAAEEDQLSLEDLIVFFELTRQGSYGRFRGQLTHYDIMQKLEQFRQERYTALQKLREIHEAEKKQVGPLARISPEPTAIKHLFEQAGSRTPPLKKIG